MAKKEISAPNFHNIKYGKHESNLVKGRYADLVETIDEVSYELDEEGFAHAVHKLKVVPVKQKFEGMKASDYSLNNLVAVGAVDNLKFCQYSGDIDKTLVNVDKLMDAYDAASLQEQVEIDKNINISEE